MRLKVYEIKKEYQLESEKVKEWFVAQTKYQDNWWNTKLVVANSKDDALSIYKERYKISSIGELFSDGYYFREVYSRKKAYVIDVDLKVKEVNYSIDVLKERLQADDFMKYFIARNIEYTELFGK